MTNLLGSLETARQSLNAQRRGLMVTGHNIANVNTPNYAREQVEIAIDVRGHSQSGSNVTKVTQVRDKILESRLFDRETDILRSLPPQLRLAKYSLINSLWLASLMSPIFTVVQ